MKLNRKQFNKWIKALRSGEYKQTNGKLQNRGAYCCLGVACKLVIPKNKLELKTEKTMQGAMPYEQTYAPSWLQKISEDFEKKTYGTYPLCDSEYSQVVSLVDLNDTYNFKFDEIADMLELVYVHKAFD